LGPRDPHFHNTNSDHSFASVRTISTLITEGSGLLRFATSQFDDDNYPHQNTMTWCLVSELPPMCRDRLVNLSLSLSLCRQKARIKSRARSVTPWYCRLHTSQTTVHTASKAAHIVTSHLDMQFISNHKINRQKEKVHQKKSLCMGQRNLLRHYVTNRNVEGSRPE
jgi:hypothetical protein